MKKQLFRYSLTVISTIAMYCNAAAQVANPIQATNPRQFISGESRPVFASSGEGSAAAFNERAAKDFTSKFGNTGNANWFTTNNGFLVRFENDGVLTRIFYDQKGRWSATIRSYGQDRLPQTVRRLVKSVYYDYNIYLVDEVTAGDKKAYLVKIKDEETFKTIRVIDEDMDVYEDFLRSKAIPAAENNTTVH